jgi:4'-phosphopantetheinyl transferase
LLGFATSFHLGVDLEPARRRAFNPLGVARRYFTDSEYSALAAMPPAELDAAFLRTWACKEAVVKASGQGIANQFCRFSVETNPARPAAVLDYNGEPAPGWSLALMHPDTRFLGAVAAPFAGLRIRAFKLLPATVCANG